ncbi:putative F-box/LRR-repeat protein 23 [Tanacetum coccineum]
MGPIPNREIPEKEREKPDFQVPVPVSESRLIRSCQLRRLEVVNGYRNWVDALIKFPLLEELNLYSVNITKEEIEAVGRYCPLLKTFKVNSDAPALLVGDDSDPLIAIGFKYYAQYNELPIAIGKTLHELKHLELIGSNMMNAALQAILDGCRHLETLDLRGCVNIHLKGDLGKRCSEQIKYLKRPKDPLKAFLTFSKNDMAIHPMN